MARFTNPDERPYFLWNEQTTVAQFRAALASASEDEKALLLGRLMREARDPDVCSPRSPKSGRCSRRSSATSVGGRTSGRTC